MSKLSVLTILWILQSVHTYRLPTTIYPEHYKLEVLTHLGGAENFNFDGKVWIQTICRQSTQNITLHSKDLIINKDTLKVTDISSAKMEDLTVSKIDFNTNNEFLIITMVETLKNDHKYEIFIEFYGVLDESLTGFYRSSYIEHNTKKKKWLGTTQFEATKARKAFPCFDEPAMKAIFDIKIGRKDGYTAISNMPLQKTEPIEGKNGWYWDKFEPSVPMSTYLVAYIVFDFGYKQSKPSASNNVTFRVWSRKEALNQVEFARDVGPKALEFYEDFFNIKYPLPKQDMVALPDFNAGAMENWGLITYREIYLLFDPKISSTTSQYNVASVISHELAHQWFGNLVTMKWWTDLWLNEGFATYMAGLAVHHIFPQWNSLNEEAVKALLDVFRFDSLKTSHPVSVPIGHPDEIEEIFDTISYKKGSYLIRMMSLFLGKETLRQGVSNYLKEHKYENAEQDDLWESLTKQAHKNGVLPENLTVKTIMDTWTLQTGYPVITVHRNYDKNEAEITQERFLKDMLRTKDKKNCWWVPLSYTTRNEMNFNDSKPKSWLSCPLEQQIITNLPDDNNWILFNIDIAGIYKINYDEKNWKLLIDALKTDNYDNIPTLNRVQLIDDVSDLAWTGMLKYNLFFDLITYLSHEDEYLPWKAALSNINVLNRQLKRSPSYGDFKVYMKKLLTPIYSRIGGLLSETDSKYLDAIKNQILIVNWACRFEVADCVTTAKDLVKEWQEFPKAENPVPKDLRGVVYCTAIRHGGEKEWNFIWQQYKKSNVATEKYSILNALGCTKEIWLLNRYLNWSLNENSGIRKQDSGTVFSTVVGNDVGYYVAKDFFFSHIGEIHKYLGSNARLISRYLSALANQMSTLHEYQQLEKFTNEQSEYLKEMKKGVEQSLENVQLNVQWRQHHLEHINEFLKNFIKEQDD